jgi:hypothetical protein
MVCHKGRKTLCVSEADVAAHISHGDQLGECVVEAARVATDRSQLFTRNDELPDRFRVFNAPNPVSTITNIYYELPVEGHVSITVFDMLGRKVTTLVDAGRMAGYHSQEFNVAALQQGLYIYRITVKTKNKVWVQTGKISVVE